MAGSPWMKIAVFVAVVTMLGMLVTKLLDPGLGRADDESRRAVHPAGFSVVVPLGWKWAVSQDQSGPSSEMLGLSPEKGIGFQDSIEIKRLPANQVSRPDGDPAAKEVTFQGRPARALLEQQRRRWLWTMVFTRDEDPGVRYEMRAISALQPDMENGPIRPFLDTFRSARRPASTATAPTTAPAHSG